MTVPLEILLLFLSNTATFVNPAFSSVLTASETLIPTTFGTEYFSTYGVFRRDARTYINCNLCAVIRCFAALRRLVNNRSCRLCAVGIGYLNLKAVSLEKLYCDILAVADNLCNILRIGVFIG